MFQHNVTGLFGCGKSFEWRADDLHREPILIKRTPGGYVARFALKAGAAAALVTDHKRKAIAARIPNLNVFDRDNDTAELHDVLPETTLPRPDPINPLIQEFYVALLSPVRVPSHFSTDFSTSFRVRWEIRWQIEASPERRGIEMGAGRRPWLNPNIATAVNGT